jgi:hypothetical protein
MSWENLDLGIFSCALLSGYHSWLHLGSPAPKLQPRLFKPDSLRLDQVPAFEKFPGNFNEQSSLRPTDMGQEFE